MKKITLLAVFTALTLQVSQAQEVLAENANGIFGITIDGGFLYVAETGTNNIVRYDLSESEPEAEIAAQGGSVPADVAVSDGNIYVTNFDQNTTGFVSVFDPSDETPATLEVVTTTVGQTIFFDIDEDTAYLGHRDTGEVTSINLSADSPEEENIGFLPGAYGMSVANGRMAISTNGVETAGLYYQADLENTFDPVQIVAGVVLGVYIDGDFLYYYDFDLGEVRRIGLEDDTFTPFTVFSLPSTDGVYGITRFGETLYASNLDGSIVSFDLNTLSTEDIQNNSFAIYPNPAQNIINITHNNDTLLNKVTIIDMAGRSSELPIINNTVDISSYASGIYMLQVATEDGSTVKRIIKE